MAPNNLQPNLDQILADLRASYDATAAERDAGQRADWKVHERAAYLALLRREKRRTLLELGAGPGVDAAYFQTQGLDVTAVDNSPEMVRFCRDKGLRAHVMSMTRLDFPAATFDAAYALNSLLHVPHDRFTAVLDGIGRVLRPGAPFLLGQYGGQNFEGVWPEDHHVPPRFYANYSDQEILQQVSGRFRIEQFRKIYLPDSGSRVRMHFQLLICRSPA